MGGEYRVSVIVVGQETRPFSKILNVAPKLILKKAPDMGAVKKQ